MACLKPTFELFRETLRSDRITGRVIGESSRRGAAPVEMTLALPLLMLMMGAIMVFGINSCWKLRTEIVSRDVTWRNRHPHKGHYNSNHDVENEEWTNIEDDDGRNKEVSIRAGGGPSLSSISSEQIVQAPIIRGTLPVIDVNSNLLDLSRSVDEGEAHIVREPTVLPVIGEVNFTTKHSFIGDMFNHSMMGIGQNWDRRFPHLYGTDLDTLYDDSDIQSAIEIVKNARDPACLAIDEDEEFQRDPIRQSTRPNCRYPDFHPRISFSRWSREGYTRDHEWVKENVVDPLATGAIPRVPRTMVRSTIGLYRRLQALETEQAQIDQWEELINELEEFLGTL